MYFIKAYLFYCNTGLSIQIFWFLTKYYSKVYTLMTLMMYIIYNISSPLSQAVNRHVHSRYCKQIRGKEAIALQKSVVVIFSLFWCVFYSFQSLWPCSLKLLKLIKLIFTFTFLSVFFFLFCSRYAQGLNELRIFRLMIM